MNPTIEIPEVSPAINQSINRLEACVRENPGRTLLAATGLGLAVVLIARAMAPTPRNRASALLEDIQQSLSELAHLGYDRASELGNDGAQAVSKGVHSIGAMHLDQKFTRGLKKLFS